MANIIKNKKMIRECAKVTLPKESTLHSLELFINRLVRKYPPKADVKINDLDLTIVYLREETDEEYVMRIDEEQKQKKKKQDSNKRSGFFKKQ